jgi:hypothetical protein
LAIKATVHANTRLWFELRGGGEAESSMARLCRTRARPRWRRSPVVAFLDPRPCPRGVSGYHPHTDEAIAALEPVSACADLEYVSHRGTLPEDGEDAARAASVLDRLARSVALEGAGRYADALEQASLAVADAEDLGAPAVMAQALLQRGTVHAHQRQGERTGSC